MKKWQTGLNIEEPEQQSAGYFQVQESAAGSWNFFFGGSQVGSETLSQMLARLHHFGVKKTRPDNC